MEQQSIVEASIKDALRHARLSKQVGLFGLQVSCEVCRLDLILNRLSIAAEALLRSDDIARIKNCERCSWLFVDRGRGRPRRWCSMATCGSRAKSARYYSRHRQDSSRPAD